MEINWPTSFDNYFVCNGSDEKLYIYEEFSKKLSFQKIQENFLLRVWEQKVKPFYKKRRIEPVGSLVMVIDSLLENSRYYSGVLDVPISLEMLLKPDSLLVGVCDGGCYFKRRDVKKCWEAKELHPEVFYRDKTVCDDGHTTGRHISVKYVIYPFSQFIYIDNDLGKVLIGLSGDKHFRKIKE